MLEKLWNDIEFIYNQMNLAKRLLINDLMIISQDNFYLIYYKVGEISTQIRIEKNYNLVKMWSDETEVDMTNYKIHVEVGDQIYTSEKSMIELTYKIIKPFLREAKLNEIGI
jgi:hypothetical protein